MESPKEAIFKIVTKHTGVTEEDIISNSRYTPFLIARYITALLLLLFYDKVTVYKTLQKDRNMLTPKRLSYIKFYIRKYNPILYKQCLKEVTTLYLNDTPENNSLTPTILQLLYTVVNKTDIEIDIRKVDKYIAQISDQVKKLKKLNHDRKT